MFYFEKNKYQTEILKSKNMKKARFFLLALLVPALIQVSCKKDDPPAAPATPTYKAPVSATMGDVVPIPVGLETKANTNTDLGASFAVTYMGMANGLSSFGGMFSVPEGTPIQSKKSGPSVYYWSYGEYSHWMTYSDLGDNYTWKYEYEFPGHPRFTYISAEELKTGKGGNWKIYNIEIPTQDTWTYTWSINSSNTFTASLVLNDGSSQDKFDVVSNANNSGSFKYYVASVLYAEVIWNSNGSGSYTFYGDMASYSGTWTAK
jgi:hypothetical protein